MKILPFFLSLVILCSIIHNVTSLNAILRGWSLCEDKKYLASLVVYNFKHVGDYVHVVDANLTSTIDMGANLKFDTIIYKDKKKLPVNFGGKDTCRSLQGLLREVFNKAASEFNPKIPAMCPVKKGVYTARKMTLDLKKIVLPVPLKGHYRLHVPVFDVSINKEATCVDITADLE